MRMGLVFSSWDELGMQVWPVMGFGENGIKHFLMGRVLDLRNPTWTLPDVIPTSSPVGKRFRYGALVFHTHCSMSSSWIVALVHPYLGNSTTTSTTKPLSQIVGVSFMNHVPPFRSIKNKILSEFVYTNVLPINLPPCQFKATSFINIAFYKLLALAFLGSDDKPMPDLPKLLKPIFPYFIFS